MNNFEEKKIIHKTFIWSNKSFVTSEFDLKLKIRLIPTCGGEFKVVEQKEVFDTFNNPLWSPSERLLFWGEEGLAKKFFKQYKNSIYINGRLTS